tara:strand:+ start:45689 stop:49060 length:3372 start_codon:yes stop_codon:yes gene_type:complete
MALTSPGVQVSVIDESFYTPAEPGTVPMVFVASAENRLNSSGTGTATGTLKANAGKPFLLTSQRDLSETFGDPVFKTDSNNNPIHAGELNEYGLQSAYSFLGVSNRAYVVRADLDTAQLEPTAIAPAANPAAGTYWFDTQVSLFGIQQWNGSAITTTGGQSFTNKVPRMITAASDTDSGSLVTNGYEGMKPKSSIGAVGDYAIVATSTLNRLYYRNTSGTWVLVGSDPWSKSWPTVKGTLVNPSFSGSSSFTINGTVVSVSGSDTVTDVAATINGLLISGVTASAVDGRLEIYSDGTGSAAGDSTAGGNIDVVQSSGTALGLLGITAGTYYPPALQISGHTSVPEFKSSDTYSRPTGSVWFKTTQPNLGARIRIKEWNDQTLLWDAVEAPIYDTNEAALYGLDKANGGSGIAVGDVFAKSNTAGDTQPLATFTLYRRSNSGVTSITSSKVIAGSLGSGSKSFNIKATDAGQTSWGTTSTVTFTAGGVAGDASLLAGAINDKNIENVSASVDTQNRVVISHSQGGDIHLTDTSGALAGIGYAPYVSATSGTVGLSYADGTNSSTSPNQFIASNWAVLTYTASDNAPTATATNGQLWYSSVVDEVDLLVHNGTTWVGYLYNGGTSGIAASPYYNADASLTPDPSGPIVSASEPTVQSDGTALKTGDIWISTADLENYPTMYRYNAALASGLRWVLLDSSDQTSEDGILFADARYATSGGTASLLEASSIEDLLNSAYLDTDAPDPALYPKGMLLWNTRRSGFNVKKFVRNYVDVSTDNTRYAPGGSDESMDSYYPHRWVTESGNQENGAGSFGRKAQRKVVVQALQAVVNKNDDIRDDESRLFNLMATPGYPELIGEMISLNNDRGLTAFIVGDSPFRLTPDATSLNNWATNVNKAVEDNDNGLVSRDEYLGVFYPAGFTSDNFGRNVVVPASHMMLRTIALSDQVSYPWFAPAGTRRGGISNASSTGYINSEGEFTAVALNEGQRDTLYSNNINPITFITGAGLVNFGQKTRARAASSLDRINVARLVIYLRSQLNQLAKPYIFEPNDKITRDEIKQAAESLMLELVGQRALYDFLVVCDESNNTASRIDKNELYLDIAIEPVKAVEFIYIPLRLKNTGEIAGL